MVGCICLSGSYFWLCVVVDFLLDRQKNDQVLADLAVEVPGEYTPRVREAVKEADDIGGW